ncbi:hypothetical protein FOCC_FOCC011059, partial [Frankliniella occidentalis]
MLRTRFQYQYRHCTVSTSKLPKSASKGKVLKSLEEEVDYLMQSFSEPGGSRQITVTETKSSQKVDLTGVAKNIPVKVCRSRYQRDVVHHNLEEEIERSEERSRQDQTRNTGSCADRAVASGCEMFSLMHYFGIAQGVCRTVTAEYLAKCTDISLDFFTDGLSPYKSVKSKVWPILCRLSATDFSYESAPFLVSVFCGKMDPIPAEFLRDFVCEAKDLETNGMKINGIRYEVRFQKFIADQPARAKMKCVNGEGPRSLVQCERCTIIGKTANFITHFSSSEVRRSNPTLRTDQSVRRRLQPSYHKDADSPLLALNVDMCFLMCYDPMHILYCGVVHRLWDFIVGIRRGSFHLTVGEVKKVNDFMEKELTPQLPTDFSRSLRGIDSYKMYKGTEWRRFLLYDGILIFKKFLPNRCYKNFLLLSCSVRILSSQELLKQENLMTAAKVLLDMFVGDCEKKFGKDFLVMKVHCLTHLVEEVKRHGPLDRFSAFPFESYLSRINKAMRAHGRCIEQIVGRVMEGYLLQPVPVVMRSPSRPQAVLSKEITAPGDSEEGKRTYLRASLPDLVISADKMRDSIYKTYRNEVVRVSRIVHDTALDE